MAKKKNATRKERTATILAQFGLRARRITLAEKDADRLAESGVKFAYLCKKDGKTVTVPVNDDGRPAGEPDPGNPAMAGVFAQPLHGKGTCSLHAEHANVNLWRVTWGDGVRMDLCTRCMASLVFNE